MPASTSFSADPNKATPPDAAIETTPATSAKVSIASLRHVLKHTGLFGFIQFIAVLLSVVRNKLSALWLQTAGVGLMDGYARSAEMIGAGTNLGIAFGAVPHLSQLHETGNQSATREYVRTVRSWILIAAVLGAALTAGMAELWSVLIFDDRSHASAFVGLSALVALTTLSGGEMAVLKSLRALKPLALITAVSSVGALGWFVVWCGVWGLNGIIAALVATAATNLGLQLVFSCRLVPYRVALLSWRCLQQGLPTLRLGLSYALSGFIGTGGEVVVRALLVRYADRAGVSAHDALGIYAAGFTLTVSYARLILMSMDADYYPRLSAAVSDVGAQNLTVNRQVEVLGLLMTPFLIVFSWLLPYLVRWLYSPLFVAASPMALCASFYMYFKAISTPIAYLSLAHAKSRLFLKVESAYTLFFVALVGVGFYYGGFVGAGGALSLTYALYTVLVVLVGRFRFGYEMPVVTRWRLLLQFLLLGLSLCATLLPFGLHLMVLCGLLAVSLWAAWRGLSGAFRH